jgi:hypothetical protein
MYRCVFSCRIAARSLQHKKKAPEPLGRLVSSYFMIVGDVDFAYVGEVYKTSTVHRFLTDRT